MSLDKSQYFVGPASNDKKSYAPILPFTSRLNRYDNSKDTTYADLDLIKYNSINSKPY